MEPKHFNLLAMTSILSLLLAGGVYSAYDSWSYEKISGEKLLPQLSDGAGQVNGLMLQQGQETLTLTKTDTGWVIKERANYPALVKPVRQLVVGLSEAEVVEPKTRLPERYARLELEDPTKDGAKSTRVVVQGKAGKAIAEVVIGKRKVAAFGTGKAGTYVRKPGAPQAWLANQNIRAPLSVSDWVNPVFFEMDPKDVAALTVENPNAPAYKVVVDDAKKPTFKVGTVPAGVKLKDGVNATEMVTALKTLELLDVRKTSALPEGDKVVKGLLETTDGMKIAIRLQPDGTDRWIAMKVVADGSKAERAKALKVKIDGWAFKVADWRMRQIFKESKDLFESLKVEADKETEKAATQPTPAATDAKAADGAKPGAAKAEEQKPEAAPAKAPQAEATQPDAAKSDAETPKAGADAAKSNADDAQGRAAENKAMPENTGSENKSPDNKSPDNKSPDNQNSDNQSSGNQSSDGKSTDKP